MTAAEHLVKRLRERKIHVVFVESCTGGALASALTDIPGASEVLEDSFVTYSNDAKVCLGVPTRVIEKFGVYSNECAEAMACAGLERSVAADVGVGVTGSFNRVDPANPEGSIPGEVFVAFRWFTTSRNLVLHVNPALNRKEAKAVIVDGVFQGLLEFLEWVGFVD